MRKKSDEELQEIVRERSRLTPQYEEARSKLKRREAKQQRRPAWTRAIVGAILLGVVILSYLRTC